jgi:tetratricopeptide (TPR) repeat protein
MSDVNWRLITRRRDHTFQAPVPELTARFGVPNACTTCHENRSPEWAADTMDRWYSNRDRRARIVKMAETLYRAGAGDTTVLPDVARTAVDRSHGPLIRASAAEFAEQLIARSDGSGASAERVAPAVINALIGAAADPEPVVRIKALRALGLISDARVPAALSAHLNDDVRLVRVAVAEALMARGITHLDGANGAALARAQEEWAESLRTFNDIAADQTTLGWLDAARGRADQAVKELQGAVALDPTDARPHVYLGVIAARDGRFDEALQEFRVAKRLSPSYHNLDRLIDEAAKRGSKPR